MLTCPSSPQVPHVDKPGKSAEKKGTIFNNTTVRPGTPETCFPTSFYLALIIYAFLNVYNL